MNMRMEEDEKRMKTDGVEETTEEIILREEKWRECRNKWLDRFFLIMLIIHIINGIIGPYLYMWSEGYYDR